MKTKILMGISLWLFCSLCNASALNYTYLQIGVIGYKFDQKINIGGIIFDGTAGADIKGSYQINDLFSLFISSHGTKNEAYGLEIKENGSIIGVQLNQKISNSTDVIFGFGADSVEGSVCAGILCGVVKDNGTALGIGLRSMVSVNSELNFQYLHESFSDFGDMSSSMFGYRYHFNENSSAGLSFGWNDDHDKIRMLNYRYAFSK